MLRLLFAVLSLAALLACFSPPLRAQGANSAPEPPRTVLQTTVRRVVVDVVVTDKQGNAVPDLTAADFTVEENDVPQQILSFERYGFSAAMDYTPGKLPPQPPNTFINLPSTPEKGPLYVLLFDLANMDNFDQQGSPGDHSAQMWGRQQLIKFIRSKPEGTRFAIFVHSDGLYLVQGFTSDRQLLVDTLDPKHPLPHLPKVFLMGANFGAGERNTAVAELEVLSQYMAEMPGRKNLIWFASNFPLSLYINDTLDGPRFQEQLKAVLNLLAEDQIAVYPVDARGVILNDAYGSLPSFSGPPAVNAGGPISAGGGVNAATGATPRGQSLIGASYGAMDYVADETGGHAFYSSNDVAGELAEATHTGENYYTLTYSPTDRDLDGKLRRISVKLRRGNDHLAYRRSYYALPNPANAWHTAADLAAKLNQPRAGKGANTTPEHPSSDEAGPDQSLDRPASDTLSINMQHGAPQTHALVFAVHARSPGRPEMGTPEQMAQLAMQPAYFHNRRKGRSAKPLPPEPLQAYNLGFRIFTRQFREGAPLNLEIAAAAYDRDGALLNAVVRSVSLADGVDPKAARSAGYFSLDEALSVPVRAAYLRFAVNDVAGRRVGSEEIRLPLAPDPTGSPTAQATPGP